MEEHATFPTRWLRPPSVPASNDGGATEKLGRRRGAQRRGIRPPSCEALEARQLLAHTTIAPAAVPRPAALVAPDPRGLGPAVRQARALELLLERLEARHARVTSILEGFYLRHPLMPRFGAPPPTPSGSDQVTISPGRVSKINSNTFSQQLTLINQGQRLVAGPINLVVNVPSGVVVLNQTSTIAGHPAVLVTSGNLAAGQFLPATVLYRAPSQASLQGTTFSVATG